MAQHRTHRSLYLLFVFVVFASDASAAASHYHLPGGAAKLGDPFIAAGYRSLFTCSAHFLMGRPLDDILLVELADTAELELPVPEIDTSLGVVRASDGRGNELIAAYRESMGCTLLPPNWHTADIPRLPYVFRPETPDLRDIPYPMGDSADSQPNERLQAVLDKAFDASSYGEGTLTVGIVVVKDGKLVAEQYRHGFGIHQGYRTWSTAKSISVSLIGIAVRDGLMNPDQPVPIPEWSYPGDPRSAITPKHLMWMSSGLWSKGNNTNAVYFGGQDVISGATGTPLEVEPGTRWKYANNDTLLLLRSLRHVLNDDRRYLRYPYDELFSRIGMHHTWMETDHLGNFIGSSQVYTTARDLSRLGLLYLNDGVWQGERVLPEGWTEFVATTAPSRPRQQGRRGYGAQFWLLDQLPGVPEGTYTSAGNKGQYATVVPEHNLVVVRTGVDPAGVGWSQDQLVVDIVAAFGS